MENKKINKTLKFHIIAGLAGLVQILVVFITIFILYGKVEFEIVLKILLIVYIIATITLYVGGNSVSKSLRNHDQH